jgi:hypothetical protein
MLYGVCEGTIGFATVQDDTMYQVIQHIVSVSFSLDGM